MKRPQHVRWDRTERISAGIFTIVTIVLAWQSLATDNNEWRFEYARAVDAAGMHLFFCGPILLAVCALAAQRRAVHLAPLAATFPQPRLGARAVWIPYAALACILQAGVITVALVVAHASHAIAAWSYQPFLRQLCMIVGLAALGALLGATARSVALPGAVLVLGFAVALLAPATNLRDFLLAGAATFDFSYDRYTVALMVLGVLFALATAWLAYPLPHLGQGWITFRTVAANLALAAAMTLLVASRTYDVVPDTSLDCQIQTPEVCGASTLGPVLATAADAATAARRTLPASARAWIPRRLVVASPEYEQGRDTIYFDSSMLGDRGAIERAVLDTIAGQGACSPRPGTTSGRHWLIGQATLYGWLQKALHVADPHTYPGEEVSRLLRLSPPVQRAAVSAVMKDVWACHDVDLSSLR